MDGGRKTRDKQSPFCTREHLVKLAPYRSFAWGVALAFNVGRILKQGQNTLFAVLGKRVEIKHLVVGRRGVGLEIAGVNQYAERRVNGERNAINQDMHNVNRMYSKR